MLMFYKWSIENIASVPNGYDFRPFFVVLIITMLSTSTRSSFLGRCAKLSA